MSNKRKLLSLKKCTPLDSERPTTKRKEDQNDRDAHQLPSFEQMRALHLTREEMHAIMDKFADISMRGVFIIVKWRIKRKRAPRSILIEVTATGAKWYDRYGFLLHGGDVENQKFVTTRAGYEATKDGELFRRSIINVRSAALTKEMYDRWVDGADKTAFPASAATIDASIATVKRLRRQAGVERAVDKVAASEGTATSTPKNTQED